MDNDKRKEAEKLAELLRDITDAMPPEVREKLGERLLEVAPLKAKVSLFNQLLQENLNKFFKDCDKVQLAVVGLIEDGDKSAAVVAGTGELYEQQALIEYFADKWDELQEAGKRSQEHG